MSAITTKRKDMNPRNLPLLSWSDLNKYKFNFWVKIDYFWSVLPSMTFWGKKKKAWYSTRTLKCYIQFPKSPLWHFDPLWKKFVFPGTLVQSLSGIVLAAGSVAWLRLKKCCLECEFSRWSLFHIYSCWSSCRYHSCSPLTPQPDKTSQSHTTAFNCSVELWNLY